VSQDVSGFIVLVDREGAGEFVSMGVESYIFLDIAWAYQGR
jgi:hypothetical protein